MLTSTADSQIPQRHHSDPPGLWIWVMLGSGVLHGLGFWLFQGVLTGNLLQLKSRQTLIPIDIISEPPPVRSQPHSTQPRTSTPTRQPQTVHTSTQLPPQRQTLSTSTSSTRLTPSVKSQQGTSTRTQPTQSNPSQNQPRNKPSDHGNKATKPSPTPASSGSSELPPKPISPTPQQGVGLLVNVPSSLRISGSLNDTPNKLALLKTKQTNFPPDTDVGEFASNLDQPLVLEVFLLIDRTGTPTVEQVISVSEQTSGINLTQLVQAIIQTWEFEPTYNNKGEPFDQTYQLALQITPRSP